MLEITGAALYYEGQGNAGLGMLRSLLEQIAVINGRKTLVLISAGMMASDVPGGRPDIGELGIQVGKEAERSNTSIYTLFLDTSATDRFQAQVRGADKNLQSESRDSEVLGRWLDQFSGAAGGALFHVQVGSGEYAFDRVLSEISAYYMLGVEPADEDRDGRTHEIKVKTNSEEPRHPRQPLGHGAQTRCGGIDGPARRSGPEVSCTTAPRASRPTSRPWPMPTIAASRIFSGAWPAPRISRPCSAASADRMRRGRTRPKRTAVFALELAVAALQSHNQYARDEGGRLLAEYNARVRQPEGADAFECSWLWTEVAALEGLFIAGQRHAVRAQSR